jgi:hypothetical protein
MQVMILKLQRRSRRGRVDEACAMLFREKDSDRPRLYLWRWDAQPVVNASRPDEAVL